MRYWRGSAEARDDSLRCASAHSDTVRSGSGRMPRRQARRISSAPSKPRSKSSVRSSLAASSLSEADAEIGEGFELRSDVGFQHSLQDRGLDDHRLRRTLRPFRRAELFLHLRDHFGGH